VVRHLVSYAVFPPDEVATAARLAIGEILAKSLAPVDPKPAEAPKGLS
jgi:hypothetical protein